MKLLVTGGAGFIGSAFCASAKAKGHDVRVIDVVAGHDLGNKQALEWQMQDYRPDWVIHLAATPGVSSAAGVGITDIKNTANLLETMIQGTKILFVSTGSVYGRQYMFPTTEHAPIRPQESYYASAKLACEGLVSSYCGQTKSTGVVLRLGTIIGPGNNKGFIRDFVSRLAVNPTKLVTWGNGEQIKSYLHIADMVTAMWATIEHADGYSEYNVSHDKHASIKQCIPWVLDEMGVRPVIEYGTGETGTFGDIPVIKLCNTKLRDLGWEPQYSIENAVRANVRWLLDNAKKAAA